MKSEEEDVAGGVVPHRGRGVVLTNVSHACDASCPVVTTKLRENQTSCNAVATKVMPAITIVLTTRPELK
jgi:hypothetical protein